MFVADSFGNVFRKIKGYQVSFVVVVALLCFALPLFPSLRLACFNGEKPFLLAQIMASNKDNLAEAKMVADFFKMVEIEQVSEKMVLLNCVMERMSVSSCLGE